MYVQLYLILQNIIQIYMDNILDIVIGIIVKVYYKWLISVNNKTNLLKDILPYDFDNRYLLGKLKFIKNPQGCILFTDVVSYCEIAENYTDTIIFLILNDMYTRFDNIISKYKYIQKVETIGDAYMAVGDMNNLKCGESMVIEMIDLAFQFLQEINKVRTPNHKLQIRVGIHIGSYTFGLIGKLKPRLCLVGKHINKASRVQSTAMPN